MIRYRLQFVAIINCPGLAHRIQQSKWRSTAHRYTIANHSHERNDAGTACHELDRLSLFFAPHEPAADWASQLQTIVDCEFLREIR